MKVGGQRVGGMLRSHHGFTIVETLIVLGVTGLLFVVIAASLTGRQNAAEFAHAIQSIQSQLQQTVDEIAAGYYPNQGNFTCSNVGNLVQLSVGAAGQGTNEPCVFLGKVIQLDVAGTDPEQYRTYTIAGLNNVSAGPVNPFAPVDPTVVGIDPDFTSYSVAAPLEYGLHTVWIQSYSNSGCKAAACSIGAIGILTEPGNLASDASGGSAPQIDLFPIAASKLGQQPTQAEAVGQIQSVNGGLRDPSAAVGTAINPPLGVQICFASGGTNQSGLITIGGSGRQLTVKLDIRDGPSC